MLPSKSQLINGKQRYCYLISWAWTFPLNSSCGMMICRIIASAVILHNPLPRHGHPTCTEWSYIWIYAQSTRYLVNVNTPDTSNITTKAACESSELAFRTSRYFWDLEIFLAWALECVQQSKALWLESCEIKPRQSHRRMRCVQALGRNPLAAEKLDQQVECQEAASCTGVCETTSSGSCIFPGFFDFTPFVTSRTPFCNYIRQDEICDGVSNPASCTGACMYDSDDDELKLLSVFPSSCHATIHLEITIVNGTTVIWTCWIHAEQKTLNHEELHYSVLSHYGSIWFVAVHLIVR